MYDISNRKSFLNIKTWMAAINEHASDNITKVLVGNKTDLDYDQREVSKHEGLKLANDYGIPFYEVSAKNDL